MKVGLAQINPRIGAIDANLQKIIDLCERAHRAQAALCVFPAQAITGAPARDLLWRVDFITAAQQALDRLRLASRDWPGMGVVVGCPLPASPTDSAGNTDTNGHLPPGHLHDCACLLADGELLHRQARCHLSCHSDDHRYFQPAQCATSISFRGHRIALIVGDDIEHLSGDAPGNAPSSPHAAAFSALVSPPLHAQFHLAATPFSLHHRLARRAQRAQVAGQLQCALISVNAVGGHDTVICDGRSLAATPQGEVSLELPAFAEDLQFVTTSEISLQAPPPRFSAEQDTFDALVLGTRDYAHNNGFSDVLIGLSGGLDSALVAAVAAEALGPSHVHCVALPMRYSPQSALDDARDLAQNLGVDYRELQPDDIFENFLTKLAPAFAKRPPDVAEENLQARIRGNLLMALSNKLGWLLLTTSNKSELATGYCTLYGDMAGGLAVLADVPKTLAFRICEHLNRDRERIPLNIIRKPPSAELRPDQKDEDSLPPYPVLDAILQRHIEAGQSAAQITAAGFDADVVKRVLQLVKGSEHKRRQAAPGLQITSWPLNAGDRRLPLSHGFPA